MISIHFIDNVPLHIQTDGARMNQHLRKKLFQIVETLKEFAGDIVRVDARVSESASLSISPRTIALYVKLPGIELQASDSGRQWKMLLKHVEKRIKRQIERRKELLKRQLITNAAVAAKS